MKKKKERKERKEGERAVSEGCENNEQVNQSGKGAKRSFILGQRIFFLFIFPQKYLILSVKISYSPT